MNKPNLFVIGAMKSGTSTLHAHLAAHPSIYMSTPKEPCYFVDPDVLEKEWPEMWRNGYWKSENNYLALFENAAGYKIIGESSTDYSKLPKIKDVPQRIAEFNPDARFVYIMRDPVLRTISHYWHRVEHRNERRGLIHALRAEPEYIDVSYYAMQLRPYLSTFGAEKVFLLTFEEYITDTLKAIQRLYRWLDIDASYRPENILTKENVTPAVVSKIRGTGMLHMFRHSQLWNKIGPLVPKSIRTVGLSLAEKNIHRSDVEEVAAKEYLKPIQRVQTEELKELLNRDFQEWRTLYEN